MKWNIGEKRIFRLNMERKERMKNQTMDVRNKLGPGKALRFFKIWPKERVIKKQKQYLKIND